MFYSPQRDKKRLKKKIYKKDELKKLLSIAPDILKYVKPVWLKLINLKK